LAGPLSPRRIRLTPFPHGCHGFCCSFVAAQTTPAPSVSQSHVRGGSLQSRARRKPEPGIPDKGFLWAQLFRSREHLIPCRRYLNAPPAEVAATRLRRIRLPCRGRGMLGIRFRLRRFRPLALQRSAIPPRRGQFPSFGTFSSNLWNFVRKFSNPWKITNRHSPMTGAPAAPPPIKWGPVRYAPCFFLIFAGKLKHRETVTRCQMSFGPLMQTLCVWGPTCFFPVFSRGNETA